MTKKQTRLAIILGAVFLVLLLAYLIVLRPLLNEEDQGTKDPLQLDPGEVEGANDRIMLFPQVERASIQSIEVKNSHGGYKFVRKDNTFVIEGSEATDYSAELFSTLVTDCGYTLSKVKVANDNPDKLSVYGLDEASDPAYYILTTVEGAQHKVWVGTVIPSNGGYYVRYEGRNTVYVLDTTLETTVLAPIEAFVNPIVIMPTSLTTYFLIDDFAIYKGSYIPKDDKNEDDKKEETSAPVQDTDAVTDAETNAETDAVTDAETDAVTDVVTDAVTDAVTDVVTDAVTDPAAPEENEEEKTSDAELIVRFHSLGDEEKKKLDVNATFRMDYPGDGIYNASGFIDGVAQQFILYKGTETVKLAPKKEDLEKYGCFEDAEFTLFVVNNQQLKDKDGKTQNIPIPNLAYFSEVQKDEETGEEFRYVYSVLFNVIVRMPTYDCRFLEYDLNSWVSANLFNININKVSHVIVESEDVNITFTLLGQDSDLVVKDTGDHKPEVKNFRKFYQVILGLLKEGPVSLTEAQVKALTADEANVTAKLTMKMHSGRDLVYRFYSFGAKTFYTINGEGEFQLPTAQVTKLISDAVRVTQDLVVDPGNAV